MPPLPRADDPSSWRCAIVGAGAVGTALALRLHARHMTVAAIVSRKASDAQVLAARVNAPIATDALHSLPAAVNTVFCCTPDDALPGVALALAGAGTSWAGRVVVHTSGSLPATVLQPLADQGATTLGFHPVQTFARGSDIDAFDGIYIGLEGGRKDVEIGRALAAAIGVETLQIPAGEKASYHLACVYASNLLATLMHLAADSMRPLDIDVATAMRILSPLVDRTLGNIRDTSPEAALTGPVARGDITPIARHVEALRMHAPERLASYLVLSLETLRLAVAGGRLPADKAEAMRTFLASSLPSDD